MILRKGTIETGNQHLPVRLLPSLSIHPPIHPSIYQLKQLFIYASTQLPTHPSTHPPTTLLIHLHPTATCLSSIRLPSTGPSVCLSSHVSISPAHPPIITPNQEAKVRMGRQGAMGRGGQLRILGAGLLVGISIALAARVRVRGRAREKGREREAGGEERAEQSRAEGERRSARRRTGFSFPCSVNLAVSWC